MARRREKIQWRNRLKTWVGRVVTVADDGSLDRGDGWVDLRTDNRDLAQKVYDRWLATGVPPKQSDKETFAQAAERIVTEQLARGEGPAKDRLTRLRLYALPRIGMNEVGELEPSHVASVLDGMAVKDGKSAGYILKMRSDISQVLSQLMREGAVRSNVALGVPVADHARVDTRLRMNLTDEQLVAFQDRRGFETPLDIMVMLCREVAGYRTSDLHAAAWEHLDTEAFAWVRVRRPKTDGAVGANVAQRKVRSYERVIHGIPEHVRPLLEAYWRRLGSPKKGPLFPTQRPAFAGTVETTAGAYERQSSEVGSFKAAGTSYADDLRAAVWEAGIYSPLEGFDPASPDKSQCALQTDTETTRRLDFASLRRDYVTAIADSGVNTQTALATSGHTQINTQMRHYMKERRVQTPEAALPRRRKAEPTPAPSASPEPDRLAALEAMMTQMLTLQTEQTRGATPDNGVEKTPRHLKLVPKPT